MASLIKMTSLDTLAHLFNLCSMSLNDGADKILNSIGVEKGDLCGGSDDDGGLDASEHELNSRKPFKLYDLADTLTILCPGSSSNNTPTTNTVQSGAEREKEEEMEVMNESPHQQQKMFGQKKRRQPHKPCMASEPTGLYGLGTNESDPYRTRASRKSLEAIDFVNDDDNITLDLEAEFIDKAAHTLLGFDASVFSELLNMNKIDSRQLSYEKKTEFLAMASYFNVQGLLTSVNRQNFLCDLFRDNKQYQKKQRRKERLMQLRKNKTTKLAGKGSGNSHLLSNRNGTSIKKLADLSGKQMRLDAQAMGTIESRQKLQQIDARNIKNQTELKKETRVLVNEQEFRAPRVMHEIRIQLLQPQFYTMAFINGIDYIRKKFPHLVWYNGKLRGKAKKDLRDLVRHIENNKIGPAKLKIGDVGDKECIAEVLSVLLPTRYRTLFTDPCPPIDEFLNLDYGATGAHIIAFNEYYTSKDFNKISTGTGFIEIYKRIKSELNEKQNVVKTLNDHLQTCTGGQYAPMKPWKGTYQKQYPMNDFDQYLNMCGLFMLFYQYFNVMRKVFPEHFGHLRIGSVDSAAPGKNESLCQLIGEEDEGKFIMLLNENTVYYLLGHCYCMYKYEKETEKYIDGESHIECETVTKLYISNNHEEMFAKMLRDIGAV